MNILFSINAYKGVGELVYGMTRKEVNDLLFTRFGLHPTSKTDHEDRYLNEDFIAVYRGDRFSAMRFNADLCLLGNTHLFLANYAYITKLMHSKYTSVEMDNTGMRVYDIGVAFYTLDGQTIRQVFAFEKGYFAALDSQTVSEFH
jgi:hypothetical protein